MNSQKAGDRRDRVSSSGQTPVGAQQQGQRIPVSEVLQRTSVTRVLEQLKAAVNSGDERTVTQVCRDLVAQCGYGKRTKEERDTVESAVRTLGQTHEGKMVGTLLSGVLKNVVNECKRADATEKLFELVGGSENLTEVTKALEAGADVRATDRQGRTPMMLAMGTDVYESLPLPKNPKLVDLLREAMRTQTVERPTDVAV